VDQRLGIQIADRANPIPFHSVSIQALACQGPTANGRFSGFWLWVLPKTKGS
jgi:hypothetical protein